jgi:hypothetical protein
MAFSTESGGVNFAVNAPNLTQYSALAELKPLSFAGGMQSPLEFRAMPAFTQPSTHPEYITQGIEKGMESVGKGITAVYKSKDDEKKDLLKFEREKELARVKAQAESDYRQQTLDETKRYHDMLGQQAADRVTNVGGNKGNSLAFRNLDGLPPLPESKEQNGSLDFSYPSIKSGRDFTKPLSDKELDTEVEQMGGAEDATKLNIGNPPLADLTSPQGLEAAPDLRGEAALSALSSIPWDQVQGQYKSAGGTPAESYSPQAPSWLRSPKSVTAQLSQLGGFGDQALPNNEKALADVASYTKKEDKTINKAMEDAIGVDAIYSEQQAFALRDYAHKKGIEPKKIEATNAGYSVIWDDDEIKKYRKSLGGKTESIKPEDMFKQEEQLRGDFVAQSKNFQVLQSAWNNLKGKLENPTGASDMSVIFAFMKLLDPTSTIREGEYATASNVGTIPQTFIGKYNKAVEGNGFLDPKVRESFIKEANGMYKSSLSQHKQSTDEYRRIAKSYGLEPDRVIIDLVTKDEADQAKEEMEALGQELRSVKDQDRKTYPDFEAKKAKYIDLKEKLDAESAKQKTPPKANAQNTRGNSVFSNLLPPRLSTF